VTIARNVKPNAAGGWDVMKEGDRRAAVSAQTKEAALARARALVRREGGGDVRVLDRAGKIVRSSHVDAAALKAGDDRAAA
jgi:Uncharacterized protein conserved in bacteria (DUF2188)